MAGVEGRVALVTGAGSELGIGFATARLLRAKGAKVAITSTTDRIFERLKDLGGGQDDTHAKTADLTDSAAVTSLTEAVEEFLEALPTGRPKPGCLAWLGRSPSKPARIT